MPSTVTVMRSLDGASSSSLSTNIFNTRQQGTVNLLAQRFQSALLSAKEFPSTPKVLSIACGDEPLEIEALTLTFPNGFEYFGFDLDVADVEKCLEKYPPEKYPHLHFNVMDATDSQSIQSWLMTNACGQVDFVVLRHPVLWQTNPAAKAFTKVILDSIPRLLREGGMLYISNYHDEEYQQMKQLLKATTGSSGAEFPRSQEFLKLTETRRTALTDMDFPCYSECHALIVSHYQPTRLVHALINGSYSEQDNTALVEHYFTLLQSTPTQFDIDHGIKVIAAMMSSLGKIDLPNYDLNQLAWLLVRYSLSAENIFTNGPIVKRLLSDMLSVVDFYGNQYDANPLPAIQECLQSFYRVINLPLIERPFSPSVSPSPTLFNVPATSSQRTLDASPSFGMGL